MVKIAFWLAIISLQLAMGFSTVSCELIVNQSLSVRSFSMNNNLRQNWIPGTDWCITVSREGCLQLTARLMVVQRAEIPSSGNETVACP